MKLDIKPKACLLLLVILLIASCKSAQHHLQNNSTSFKVVGYYFLNAAIKDSSNADYDFLPQITHLNIAFINPDSAGNFDQHLAIDTLIKKAHKANVKVLASIGGGGHYPHYAVLLKEENRKRLVANLVAMVQRYNLDGIDVDLEGGAIDANYEPFVKELAQSLKRQKKLITAAIATAYKDQLTDNALREFDFVNIMSYDRTGPWRPSDPGHHSPYEMAVQDLQYWHQVRKLPKHKLVLGLPFYGYGFSKDAQVVTMTYKEAVEFDGVNKSDTLQLPGGFDFYYNNIATIKAKTNHALQNAGGVMIWQLLGDAKGEKSLLSTIYQQVPKPKGKKLM